MAIDTHRAEILRDFLTRQGLDGWFSWRPEELLLQLGHTPYWGLSFLLFLRDGDGILFVPEIEPRDLAEPEVTVVSYPWGLLGAGDCFGLLEKKVEDELDRRGLHRAAIGFTADSDRSSLPLQAAEQPPLPAAVLEALTRGMTTGALLNAAFRALYLHKTEAEIERIRRANRVACAGLEAWHKALVPGITEAVAAASAEYAIHSLIGSTGVVSARGWASVQSGHHTAEAGRFNRSTGRRLLEGDLVLIELATCVDGYWSDLTRTAAVGEAPPQASDMLHAVAAAQRAAMGAVRAGVSAHEVDAAARESLGFAGFARCFSHATGHHTGFRYHDPGFAVGPGNRQRLESGMVVTIEPGIYDARSGLGVRIEDDVAVTARGADVLSAETRREGLA